MSSTDHPSAVSPPALPPTPQQSRFPHTTHVFFHPALLPARPGQPNPAGYEFIDTMETQPLHGLRRDSALLPERPARPNRRRRYPSIPLQSLPPSLGTPHGPPAAASSPVPAPSPVVPSSPVAPPSNTADATRPPPTSTEQTTATALSFLPPPPPPPPPPTPSTTCPPPPADSTGPTPPAPATTVPTDSTACSILLCTHSLSRARAPRNHRIAVFRAHPRGENTTDTALFLSFRRIYNAELRSFWQRFFSLRGLKYISIVEYTHPEAPVLLLLDAASRNSIMYAFNKPHKLRSGGAWVDWVFALKAQPPRRFGLEFVQGWDARKIVMLAAVPWVASVFTAVLWSALMGDVQAGMAVASYILTASGGVLALLGIVSTLEG
ncbi:uncharacterized protein H6S33_006963 [Morchella sextelata]|uniref:uncharacterized protein n=1 Tax=Morchella sextelata TaxID=1174677 RepID=UPI001D05C057|nr:uncharacterized protein H6S33_006963 [Morchella sextelata]KAH0603932.1 hypothetical protein H6S33_006963 [Morchella sextelata]